MAILCCLHSPGRKHHIIWPNGCLLFQLTCKPMSISWPSLINKNDVHHRFDWLLLLFPLPSRLQSPQCSSMGKTAKPALYFLLLQLALFATLSEAEPLSLQPFQVDSFNLSLIQTPVSCKYTAIITTSFTSSESDSGQISLALGDALAIMKEKAFSSCSSGTFLLQGPCTSHICYVYLYRTGSDDWIPGSVKIYGYNSFPPIFNFFEFVPNNTWLGFNHCNIASSADLQKIPGWFLYPLVAVVASFIM